MERKLKVLEPFTLKGYALDKGNMLDFGSFPDTIYYDINYDPKIDRSGIVMLSCFDEPSGQGIVLPLIVADKYTLYQNLTVNDSYHGKVEKMALTK
jgi:hypothetical protein